MASKKKTAKKKVAKKKGKPFGGMTISFKGCNDPISKVFGTTPVAPSMMNKKLWAYIKKNKLKK